LLLLLMLLNALRDLLLNRLLLLLPHPAAEILLIGVPVRILAANVIDTRLGTRRRSLSGLRWGGGCRRSHGRFPGDRGRGRRSQRTLHASRRRLEPRLELGGFLLGGIGARFRFVALVRQFLIPRPPLRELGRLRRGRSGRSR